MTLFSSLRIVPLCATLMVACAAAGPAGAAPPVSVRADAMSGLATSLWPEAAAAGITRATFDATFAGLVADPTVAGMTERQPEFAKPLGAYLAAQVTRDRIAEGRARMTRWQGDLAAIERRTAVPASIVVAVWGLETGYGAALGGKDVVRSLATLAGIGFRPALYRGELIAAMRLLQAGAVTRAELRGSWAGAMGQPQFMPSSFERYAIDQDGDGRADIWTSVPDTLASIGNFLQQQGWQAGVPWGMEVRLPAGLDVGVGRGTFAQWTARGVRRQDGGAMPVAGEAALFFPAGAAGPAFLVTANFEVLKTYNFSDAYALSVANLADRMTGGVPFAAPWPNAVSMPRSERIALQTRLVALGYPVDNREGRISLALRDVIRQAQARVGQVPDGDPTSALLRALPSSGDQNR